MIVIRTSAKGWRKNLKSLLDRMRDVSDEVDVAVRQIIERVKAQGDEALFEYTRAYDRFDPKKDGVCFGPDKIALAHKLTPSELIDALTCAARRIEAFHNHQKEQSWFSADESGTILGQKVTAIGSVGIYIPGGMNAFPSTVLMNVIPAKIAGVENIVVVSPTPGGRVSQALLAAASIAGVEKIFRIGGAQAIAALAFGTKSIPKVDKVVGPGNIYVAHAKKLLQGTIGIDAFAGPSEILVIADSGVNPHVVALDLLSQAEHDAKASSILITPSASLAEAVLKELEKAIATLPRRDTILQSLDNHGACIVTRDLDEAVDIANEMAPEHLELMLDNAYEYLGRIKIK